MWHYLKDGIYNVSSGYETALMLKRRESVWGIMRSESSSREEDKKKWNKVWALPTTNKIKHFVWRGIRGVLSIKENRFRRMVTTELLCPVCSRDCETFSHLIF